MNINVDWVHEIKTKLRVFMSSMQEDNFSYFKYSYSGDLYSKNDNWGLANTVFAVRCLYTTGLLEELNKKQQENIYNNIIKFSLKDGILTDPVLTKRTFVIWCKRFQQAIRSRDFTNLTKYEDDIRRAETRQAFAALFLLGRKPTRPFLDIPNNSNDINKYLESFDWKTPWGAGSHANHLLFFLRMNNEFFPEYSLQNENLITKTILSINSRQKREDGCWYEGGSVSLDQKINGAMKVLNAFHTVNNYDISYPRKLIDTALSAVNDEHACNNFNLSYVLYGATIVEPKYRKDEIEAFLLKRLDIYREFYWPEYGGFSFCKKYSNKCVYGREVSKGLAEPDIHGTAMFVWGISIINKIIDFGLNWKIPLN